MMTTPPPSAKDLYARIKSLGLHGLLANWETFKNESWLPLLVEKEEAERKRRSLVRRVSEAHVGAFKPLADFDWSWPKDIDQHLISNLFSFQFVRNAENAILIGPNGIGKSMIAKNLAHQAVIEGFTVRFTTARAMLTELASQETSRVLARCLKRYLKLQLLVVDEVGYLSYDTRYADLLFEVVTGRYLKKSLVITTNRIFEQWSEVFPGATCVVTLVDRLIHKAEIIKFDGASYRLKEAQERAAAKTKTAKRKPSPS